MRVRLTFDLINKGAALPFHHQYLISELLEPYITDYLKSTKEALHIAYHFSALKGHTKIDMEGLHFMSNKVSIVFASNSPSLVENLIQKLYNNKEVLLGELKLAPISVDHENKIEFTNEMKYLCLSPLTIISPKDGETDSKLFIHPSYDAFSDALYKNTMDRMEQAGFSPEELATYFEFQLVPDKEYINKMKRDQKKFSRIYPVFIEKEKYEIRGYTFPFTFYAHPKVHEFIFSCGLGFFTESGFGMLDIANSNPNTRTTSFRINNMQGQNRF